MSTKRREKAINVNTFIWILVIFVFSLDQLSKYIVLRSLAAGESIEVIKNIFHVTLVYNTGAAFGIFKNQTIFFIVVSLLAIFGVVIYIKRNKERIFLRDVALSLILGGALGNLLDRLRFGYVIDFLDFRIWPVFNIADSAITVGAFLLLLSLSFKKPLK